MQPANEQLDVDSPRSQYVDPDLVTPAYKHLEIGLDGALPAVATGTPTYLRQERMFHTARLTNVDGPLWRSTRLRLRG
ncbi:hypothetical protein GCM10009835_03410 [Planosporangium flavigriseum]|uniref:Uncharacterized protein n=1 Tax=Planosporangium flavigriseum TaxID=373681 RepID=A0A8J3LKQ1_9ACTN|nr:hypothetical protein Pfl04_20010 [Planosporangium flavigriseum]